MNMNRKKQIHTKMLPEHIYNKIFKFNSCVFKMEILRFMP